MAKAEFRLQGDVGEIVISDPPLNLFGLELAIDVARATDEANESSARAILVRAEGDHFSAGANVEMFIGRGGSPRSPSRRWRQCRGCASPQDSR
jgi:enoyl-CoA hydratase/carnithine racemase